MIAAIAPILEATCAYVCVARHEYRFRVWHDLTCVRMCVLCSFVDSVHVRSWSLEHRIFDQFVERCGGVGRVCACLLSCFNMYIFCLRASHPSCCLMCVRVLRVHTMLLSCRRSLHWYFWLCVSACFRMCLLICCSRFCVTCLLSSLQLLL